MKKCKIIIDGGNLHYKLKDLSMTKLLDGDFIGFLHSLVLPTDSVIDCTYYVGRIRTDGSIKAQKMFNQQRHILSQLRKNGVHYSLGFILKSTSEYHEKGVDVKMAVDIVRSSYEKDCQKIILISSDTDLLPAIEIALEKGMLIHYVGFAHQKSKALISHCSSYNLLKSDHISPFLPINKTVL